MFLWGSAALYWQNRQWLNLFLPSGVCAAAILKISLTNKFIYEDFCFVLFNFILSLFSLSETHVVSVCVLEGMSGGSEYRALCYCRTVRHGE